MSLIARCPACMTLFRVVPDQLKISEGWVRCGECSEVFDAHLSLQPMPALAPEPESESKPEPEPEPEPAAQAEPPALDGTRLADASSAPSTAPGSPAVVEVPAAVDDVREPVLEAGPLAGEGVDGTSPSNGEPPIDQGEPPPVPGELPSVLAEPLPLTGEPAPLATDPAASAAEPGSTGEEAAFMRQARRRAFWQRPGVRGVLGFLAFVLALALGGQVVFHYRDRLAQDVPALRPLFAAICSHMGCRLGLPQRIESIAIESSAFTRLAPDAYRLNLTLSNRSATTLALPALELTLTDSQGQPVLRRVLQGADLGPDTPVSIAAHDEWSSVVTLSVSPGDDAARIVGYRLLAFYP